MSALSALECRREVLVHRLSQATIALIRRSVFHCPLISSTPTLILSAIVERSGTYSKSFYPSITVHTTADTLISDPAIDLIVITTPNESHFNLAKRALLSGKHVV